MHVEVSKSKRHKYCGKEFKRKLEKGLLDHETDFKCTVYENDRVSFDESTKAKMRQIGLRELRRNGIGRGTIERALHSKIKKSTAAKILAAIESYEKTINELEQIIERRKNESA